MLAMRRALPESLLCLAMALSSCGGSGEPSGAAAPRVAFITNGVADFWTVAEAGAKAGAAEAGVEVLVLMPGRGMEEQKSMVEDCLTREVKGIAISPIDPPNQKALLAEAAAACPLITHDSDAPESSRLAYVGMDNYEAGWMAGELAREALPEGGSAAIFIGRLEQDNARRRRQGVIDAFLGRSRDATRYDDPDAQPSSEDGRYTLVGTYTDQFDFARGKANVEDALNRYPELGVAVGLFGYNPPLILEALKGADALGRVQVVGFDEDKATLEGVRSGTIVGTVVQDPYSYGRESVRILAGLHAGRSLSELGVPDGGVLSIPARKITAATVEAFQAELDRNLGR
jgi:ribose transport system substrate-binding protein